MHAEHEQTRCRSAVGSTKLTADEHSQSSMFIDCEHGLVFSSSRERKVIALYCGEAEFCSLASGLCHALLFKAVMEFFSHQVARRCGARRIKHPGARVLWVHIVSKVVELNLVNTNENKEILGRTTMQRPRLMKLLEFARTQTSEVPEDDQNSMQSFFWLVHRRVEKRSSRVSLGFKNREIVHNVRSSLS